MKAAEAVIRAGILKLGGGMLEKLLAADPGHRGPRVPCGQGHEAEFVSYLDKVTGTMLGPVTLSRAWYHCAACGHGFARRDAELSVAGASLSPGLTVMNDKAAAAGPFAKAARLLEDLAAVQLAVKRVERAAEASGAAQAATVRERSQLITAKKVVPLLAGTAAGQALCRHRRHRRPRHQEGDRGQGRQGRGRPGPHLRTEDTIGLTGDAAAHPVGTSAHLVWPKPCSTASAGTWQPLMRPSASRPRR